VLGIFQQSIFDKGWCEWWWTCQNSQDSNTIWWGVN
jgi:hypothetical protein